MEPRDDVNAALRKPMNGPGDALSIAADIFASSKGAATSPQAETQAGAESNSLALLAKLLETKGSQESPAAPSHTGSKAHAAVQGDAGLAGALPALLQAFSGSNSLIKPEKLNLVKAFKPYMSDERGESIDRAIRMASIAQAAKAALAAMGR